MSDKELFLALLDVPLGEVDAFLNKHAADADQARRVAELLRGHQAAGSFLSVPSADSTTPAAAQVVPSPPPLDQPGEVLGERYKLIERIGEGGMGTVWKADQIHPIKRLVALKLIKQGMDTRQVLARFESERQALALMDHPNIAKIHDGGTLPDGRPFFVMELVRGIPITDYCETRGLSVADRVRLFVNVCQAVQHAHQKGILHRDLKPGNLLVTEHDGVPVPKVIDFGLAKAMSRSLTDVTVHTSFGAVVGTPLYMAPEQVAINALDVDTRADIFALGTVLYELLTGSTPLEKERFRTAAWEEVRRIIREEEPPKPSARISSSNANREVAPGRRGRPEPLSRFFHADLDWIVMKSLEKDRSRRYPTVGSFADDLTRFLTHEPVEAGPPSVLYRFRKFVRRYRGPVSAFAAILILLLAGIMGTTWGMLNAWKERGRALQAEATEREQKIVAQREADKAAALVNFLQNDLLGQAVVDGQPKDEGERSPDLKVRTLLDRAGAKIDGKFPNAPYTEVALRVTIGLTYQSLGLYPAAEKHLRRAVALAEHNAGPTHQMTVVARSHLANLTAKQGDPAKSAAEFATLAELQTTLSGANDPKTLALRLNQAKSLNQAAKPLEAEKLAREALRQSESLQPDSLAMAHHELARAMQLQGRLQDAEPHFRQALAIRKDRLGYDHSDVLANQINLALNLFEQRKLADAETLLRSLLPTADAKIGADHPDTLAARNNLAIILKRTQRADEAAAMLSEVLRIKVAKLGADHQTTLATRYNLANLYLERKKPELAEPLLAENLSHCIKKLGPSHLNTMMVKLDLAYAYADNGKHAMAEPLHRECRDAKSIHKQLGLTPFEADLNLGHALFMQGKYAEAEPLLLGAYDQTATQPKYESQRPRIANWLAELCEKRGDAAEAKRWREKAASGKR